MQKLDSLVKDMLEEHKGGTAFFDHLDEAIQKDETIVNSFIDMIPDDYGIIGSGKFGRFFLNYFKQQRPAEARTIITVNGGLRKQETIDDLSYLDLQHRELIFVDDSFYSGKTRNKVQMEVERNGGLVIATYVLYDGSHEKDETVHSLYRYHDFH